MIRDKRPAIVFREENPPLIHIKVILACQFGACLTIPSIWFFIQHIRRTFRYRTPKSDRLLARAKWFLCAGMNFARVHCCPSKLVAYSRPARKGRGGMFNSNRQKKMSSPTAHAKRCAGTIKKLMPGLAVGKRRTQSEALANHRVEKLSRFCVWLITCPSRQGVSRPC